MKKIIASLVAVAAAMTMSVSAAGYICANDVTPATYNYEAPQEDGFVICGNDAKAIICEDKSDKPKVDGDLTFTNRLNFKGATCYISFPAKKGETITVWALSGSKTDTRAFVIKNEAEEVIGQVDIKPYDDSSKDVSKGTVKVPADGTYKIQMKSSGGWLYQLEVK